MLKNGIWMLVSTALRLVSGLFVFVVVARQLGATDFGVLMTGFAAAGILAVPANYGLSLFLLNEAPKARDRGGQLLSQSFGLRLTLSVPLAVLVWPVSAWLKLPLLPVALLFLMHVVEACTELLCVRERAAGNFNQETRFVTVQALLQFGLIALLASQFRSLEWVAFGFLASRVLSFTMAAFTFRRPGETHCSFSGRAKLARKATPYFLDFSAQSVLVQIDAVLLGFLAGPAAVGTYQAGMRVAQGISQVITVMVNVALPRLAQMEMTSPLSPTTVLKVWVAFAAVGILLAAPMMLFATQLAHVLFGSAFIGLPSVFEVLGLFLVVRFAAAGSGMLLIAMGEQGLRAAVMLIATVVLALLAGLLMPDHGALGAAYSIAGAYGFILTSFTLLMIVRLRSRMDRT